MQSQTETKYLVNVWMVTYNHEKYITQAIKSVLMQNTSFPFQLIIGEDCSTDRTGEIVKKFTDEHPNLIKAVFNPQNIGPKYNALNIFRKCTAKYTAMLEGDDYWTDPNKLQKQIDFLENNPDFAICFHNIKILHEDNPRLSRLSNVNQKAITTIEDLARRNYIYTPSCVFRRYINEFPEWFSQFTVGDYPLHLLNAQHGKIKFIDEVMGVYRVHGGGLWEAKNFAYRDEQWIEMLEIMKEKFSNNLKDHFNRSIRSMSFRLAQYYLRNRDFDKYQSSLERIKNNNPFLRQKLKMLWLALKYFIYYRTSVRKSIS